MNKIIHDQIFNVFKQNSIDTKKIKLLKMNEIIYKLSYNNSLITYIEIDDSPSSYQSLSWAPRRKEIIPYANRILKFSFDVVCIIEIVDSDEILEKCIRNLKNQINQPYLILIVSTHPEKQIAIDNDIDFFWTTERNLYKRFTDCLNYVRGNFTFVQNIMLCNSNDIFLDNWIDEGIRLMRQTGANICGKKYSYIVDTNRSCMYKREINQEYIDDVLKFTPHYDLCWYNGIIIHKGILNSMKWELFSNSFKNNITIGIFDKLTRYSPKISTDNKSEVISLFSDLSIYSVNEYKLDKSNRLMPISVLPIIQKFPLLEYNVKTLDVKKKEIVRVKKRKECKRSELIKINIPKQEIKSVSYRMASANRVAVLLFLSNSSDLSTLSLLSLKNQSMKSDIILVSNNSPQHQFASKSGYQFYSHNSLDRLSLLNTALSQLRKLNPNCVILLEDSCCLPVEWVKQSVNLMKKDYDIIGTNSSYVYNFSSDANLITLDTENIKFINKPYRTHWSLFNGRCLSRNFLDKIDWNLFSSNTDIDLEVSFGIRVSKVASKIALINFKTLIVKSVNDFNRIGYLLVSQLNEKEEREFYAEFKQIVGPHVITQQKATPKRIIRPPVKPLTVNNGDVLISIILPTFNGWPQIKKAINTVENQTFHKYELVIVNDGSTQIDLINFLKKLSSKKIRVINHDKNRGLPQALNTGLANCEGEYVTWISDDNEIHKDFLRKHKSVLDMGKNFSYSNYVLIDKINNTSPIQMDITYSCVNDILMRWRGLPSFMWRRPIMDQIGGYNLKIQGCEDYEYIVRTFIACDRNQIGKSSDYLFTYYKRYNTLTTRLGSVIPRLQGETVHRFSSIVDNLAEINRFVFTGGDVVIWISDDKSPYLNDRKINLLKCFNKSCVVVGAYSEQLITDAILFINQSVFDIFIESFNLAQINTIMCFDVPKFHKYSRLIKPNLTIFDMDNNPLKEFNYHHKDVTKAVGVADIITHNNKAFESYAHPKKYRISNSSDFNHFKTAQSRIQPRPNLKKDVPVIGFCGPLTDWIDSNLLKRIADLPSIQVLMVAAVNRDYKVFDHPNILWVDAPDYGEQARYVSWCDIMMIPYKKKVHAHNPLEFYNYAATGKIIIGSEFDDIDTFYYKIDINNCQQVISNILKNCALNVLRKEYLVFAKRHRWQNEYKKLSESIKIDYTIIYPPLISYDVLKQRPTQLMASFAQVDRVRSIFIDKGMKTEETKKWKFCILNKSTFENDLQKYIGGKLILYYTHPDHIRFKSVLKPDFVIYDLIDNPKGEFKHWDCPNLYKSISEADLFICSAKILYDDYAHLNKNSLMISNGCDCEHFVRAIKPKKPADFPKTDRIIIGYFGSHASWVDWELIKQIANYKRDRYHVVMVGRTKVYNHRFDHPNITWIDHKSYDILPDYLAHFDICMIPFKLTEMIRGCDPLKFYEYLSVGKPVLATRMDPILEYENVCYFIDSRNYRSQIEAATKGINNKELIVARRQVALNSTWNEKSLKIMAHIVDNKHMYTIIYPPYVSWNRMYQRPQQMITALSRIDGVRCIFIDWTVRTVNMINNSLIVAPDYNSAKRYVEGKVVLYYSGPEISKSLSSYKYDLNVFELVDNPVDEFAGWKTDLERAIKKADIVSITSPIMEKYVKNHQKWGIIPNGSDFWHFTKAQHRLKKPDDFPDTTKCVVGYYGAHAPWVDWELIRKIADIDSIHVVCIGKMEKTYNLSIEHENITWLPLKPYEDLPYYLSWFDICMIPFRLTEMIKGCDPIKFYEYSAAGKPVVATRMHELEKYSDICYFIDHNNYQQMINKADMERDTPQLVAKRQAVAEKNTWADRANRFFNLIK